MEGKKKVFEDTSEDAKCDEVERSVGSSFRDERQPAKQQ